MPKFVFNIPNSLTIIRLICVPLIGIPLLSIFGSDRNIRLILILCLFAFAAITDFLDGYVARKLNQISEWGAYMDPLIDKFLIWTIFGVLLFVPYLHIPIWTFFLIIGRDLIVTQMRNYAIGHDFEFKTSIFAKFKTAFQMVAGLGIILFLLYSSKKAESQEILNENYLVVWTNPWLYFFPRNITIIVSFITMFTGIDYAVSLYKQIKLKK